MSSKNTKACKALIFPKSTTDLKILAACAKEWKKRNVKPDGSLKPNRWAPIYVERDGIKMSVRLIGDDLVLFGELARIERPKPTIKWD